MAEDDKMRIKEVTFVYIGNKLPPYALASLELARRYSGLSVHLIGNRGIASKSQEKLFRFTSTEDFYDESRFVEAARRVLYPKEFRSGFWLKTLERYFVISQYMAASRSDSIFHAELDQLLFRSDLLVRKLEKVRSQGFFVPFHTSDRAIGSVVFCNSQPALESMLDFASKGSLFASEMELIADWYANAPDLCSALPTLGTLVNPKLHETLSPMDTLSSGELGGVVDAAQLGQWVGGIDPRNVPILQTPKTKFSEDPTDQMLSKDQLSGLQFHFSPNDAQLEVNVGGRLSTTLYNLHLHSKIHRTLLRSDEKLTSLFKNANKRPPSNTPGGRLIQLREKVSWPAATQLMDPEQWTSGLRRRMYSAFKLRPSSSPFLSGDTFRKFADHVWEAKNTELDSSKVRAGDVIFCESDLFGDFKERALPNLRKPLIVILGNSEKNHEASYFEPLPGVRIFAQNLVGPSTGAEVLPIGVKNDWYSGNRVLQSVRGRGVSPDARLPRIMWEFNVNINFVERGEAAKWLLRANTCDHLPDSTPSEHRNSLERYCFVASPPGSSLDNHLTWEAMYLGCVPIVLRSHMSERYAGLGLPIWVLDSYSELLNLQESELKAIYDNMIPKFNNKAMWCEFWFSKIKSGETLN
jgi:hypothetical protein